MELVPDFVSQTPGKKLCVQLDAQINAGRGFVQVQV